MRQFSRYAKVYETINSKKNYEAECEFLYHWAGKPNSIMDIGCGTANYWDYFPSAEIAGIEFSPEMIAMSKYKDYILNADITQMKWSDVGDDFDCAMALFDVINYIPFHDWWKFLPIKKGGYFIFDIWDLAKVRKDGFKNTECKVHNTYRLIIPEPKFRDVVDLNIIIDDNGEMFKEKHRMYLYSERDIRNFCGKEFKMVDKVSTKRWQTWFKLQRL